jgi:solute carrier family 7 (cationic amino acid transporter), member 1
MLYFTIIGIYVIFQVLDYWSWGACALALSFLIAGVVAALSAFCYAELASRCPYARSAYHYSNICIAEG